jgi:beta-alanine--pyruvate transaminase
MVAALKAGLMVRFTGDTIALSPPLIINKNEIDTLFGTVGEVIDTMH